MNRLHTALGKIKMSNPVTVASGTFGPEYSELFDLNLLGAYVTKTITFLPKIGNPPPRIFETECGMLNSIGLQNPGISAFLSDYLPDLLNSLTIPLIVSFSGSTRAEFSQMLRILEEFPAIAGYEVNISCPNVENEGLAFGIDPQVVYDLTRDLAAITCKELIIKLSPNVTDIVPIALAAEQAGATSLALINTLFGMAIDPMSGKCRIARGICGYSGPAIKPIALANVYKVAQKTSLPILAMGGICDWKDALEFFFAGASAIAVGTYNFVNPTATLDVIDGLNSYLEERNLALQGIIGKISF
jgi:dihydroorotate dehydrogenase (NAD+) catalytic subunit